MKYIKTEDAVGHVLCHDITKIIPGSFKGTGFKKGHVVRSEDVPELLKLGKEHLYIWEKQEGMLHEDEAAYILADMCLNDSMSITGEPREGKIEIKAQADGLLKVDDRRLTAVNSLGEMMIATRHGNFPVKKGDVIAAMRVIPLVIEAEKMDKAKAVCGEKPLLRILPFKKVKASVIVTGGEVAGGKIEDRFGPVAEAKMKEYGAEVISRKIVPDDLEIITEAISDAADSSDVILCTGGMSVDPDDKTPGAVRRVGADIIFYGAPVLPGAMFLLAYYEKNGRRIPVMGLPGCVMYSKRTVFDLDTAQSAGRRFDRRYRMLRAGRTVSEL